MAFPGLRQAAPQALGALWAGGLWAIGFAAAPVLFAHLPQMVAGDIAGRLFALWQGLGLVFGGVLFFAVRTRPRPWPALAAAAWALDALFEFVFMPIMASLKVPGFGPASPNWHLFLVLHGVAVACYAVEAALALAVVASRRE